MKSPHWFNQAGFIRNARIATALTLLFGGVLAAIMAFNPMTPVKAAPAGSAFAQFVGTVYPQTGDFTPSGDNDVTQAEFPGQGDTDSGPAPYPGVITNRSFSQHSGNGASVQSGQKAKSNPTFDFGFEGLNHYQQRYSRGGNQFSVEPPDQGMCAGNGFVVEVVNDVFNVYNAATGASALPDNTAANIVAGFPRDVNHAIDLNSFYGYAPAINRSTGVRGQFVTDPSCIYDHATQRFFVVVLTLETVPTSGAFTGKNHLDLAVSQTSDPTGSWNIYRLPVQDDGTQGTPDHGCPLHNDGTGHGPCLGDYPHIGADANGIYITTNEYAFAPNFIYMGAQIYAFSKAALASGAAAVGVTQFDTRSSGVGGFPGFTVWPAQSPGTQFDGDNGGTEFFMSSDAADEAHCVSGTPCGPGPGTSTDLLVWSLTNTSSLNATSPALNLSNKVLKVGQYAIPPKQQQPGSGLAPTMPVPQGFCLNDSSTLTIAGLGCWRLLVSPAAHAGGGPEVVASPDSNDTRMQQVIYANGALWGALDTALSPDGGPQRAGIEFFIVNPNSSKLFLQGYLGVAGHDFTYPAIAVTASGRGVMAFTDTGDSTFPSAAFASIDAIVGVGAWSDVSGGVGAVADDGFSGYKQQRFPFALRSRWGDFGAAVVDGNSVWIASEYIAQSCGYIDWGGPFFVGGTGDNLLGTCGGATHGPGKRTALANWATRISKLTP